MICLIKTQSAREAGCVLIYDNIILFTEAHGSIRVLRTLAAGSNLPNSSRRR